ncbi:hypothetical protein ACFQ1Q_09235 [Winogradskyella litorisediminis]|uniref:YfhD family protein n=1 Tax=Winogradskyella litorisediminis TaxID=1156618 RepID=A0ABW3NA52_9FLAO
MAKDKKDMPYIVNRKPADMHDDGVHFNEELLAKKRKKELQKQKIDKKKSD